MMARYNTKRPTFFNLNQNSKTMIFSLQMTQSFINFFDLIKLKKAKFDRI